MQKIIKINSEFAIDWLIVMVLATDTFRTGFSYVLSKFSVSVLSPYFTCLLVFLPFILVIVKNRGSKCLSRAIPFMCLLSSLVVVFAVTLLIHPDYEEFILASNYMGAWQAIFRPDTGVVWFFLAFSMIRDPERLLNDMRIAAYFIIIYGLYSAVFSDREWVVYTMSGGLSTTTYNLNLGYELMFACVVLLHAFLSNKKRKLDLAVSVGAFLLTLIYGSRGPMLCFAVYLILLLWTQQNSMRLIKRIALSIVTIAVLVTIYIYLPTIIAKIAELLSKYSGNSRLLIKLKSGELLLDSGRSIIYDAAIQAIGEQGFLGRGVYGARKVIAPIFHYAYPHNIVLELVLDFGIIAGSALVVLLACKVIKTLASKNKGISSIMCILVAINMKLFISDSFWMYGYFWAMLGFMYAVGKMNIILFFSENDTKLAPAPERIDILCNRKEI